MESVLTILYRGGLCVGIIVVGTVIIKVVQKCIKRSFAVSTRIVSKKSATATTVCSSITKYIIYFFILCCVLSIWGINPASLLAIGGFASVAVGLGAQAIISDILSGVFILIEDQFSVGDMISIGAFSGVVESIGVRTTRIRSADGDVYIIPNGEIKIVTNMSKGFNRAIVDIGISYNESIDRAIDLLDKELSKVYSEGVVTGLIAKPRVLGVEGLEESAVVLRIKADCEVGENWNVERQLRRLIKNTFDREGVEIPYPQQVVYVRKD